MKFRNSLLALSMMIASVGGAYAAEDCVNFNPATTTAQFVGGEWKVVDGAHWMFSFGANVAEARRALQIIKTYKMNESCFVGRPNPSFQYLLSSNGPPRGILLQGEDCISFNPALVKIVYIPASHTWKMVQGNMWMEDFGTNRQEAHEALAIVKKYQFNKQCFVGRPGPSFRYWKS